MTREQVARTTQTVQEHQPPKLALQRLNQIETQVRRRMEQEGSEQQCRNTRNNNRFEAIQVRRNMNNNGSEAICGTEGATTCMKTRWPSVLLFLASALVCRNMSVRTCKSVPLGLLHASGNAFIIAHRSPKLTQKLMNTSLLKTLNNKS